MGTVREKLGKLGKSLKTRIAGQPLIHLDRNRHEALSRILSRTFVLKISLESWKVSPKLINVVTVIIMITLNVNGLHITAPTP